MPDHKPRPYRRSTPAEDAASAFPHLRAHLGLLLTTVLLLTAMFALFAVLLINHYEQTSGKITAHNSIELLQPE